MTPWPNLERIASGLRVALEEPPSRCDLALVHDALDGALEALGAAEREEGDQGAILAVSAFLEAVSAILTDLGRELIDSQAEAAELACDLARALGAQPTLDTPSVR